jgi:hypothetical protein
MLIDHISDNVIIVTDVTQLTDLQALAVERFGCADVMVKEEPVGGRARHGA